jgi:thymidylate synthase
MTIKQRGQSMFNFKVDDFSLDGYDPWPHIKAPVAV